MKKTGAMEEETNDRFRWRSHVGKAKYEQNLNTAGPSSK